MSSNLSNCRCRSRESCICEKDSENNKLWNEICRQFDEEKKSVQNYILKNNQNADAPSHPLVHFLENKITPLLKDGMLSALKEAEKQNCLDRQRTDFNPIDHISEYLWNYNPDFPQRLDNYSSIHDIEWVQNYLKENPRPFFPFHLIWSDEFAAIKIQSFLRGYWVRRQDEVQEVRKFWKVDRTWPTRSLDLNPCDFFFKDHLKTLAYSTAIERGSSWVWNINFEKILHNGLKMMKMT